MYCFGLASIRQAVSGKRGRGLGLTVKGLSCGVPLHEGGKRGHGVMVINTVYVLSLLRARGVGSQATPHHHSTGPEIKDQLSFYVS
jgi:hypothetical protein